MGIALFLLVIGMVVIAVSHVDKTIDGGLLTLYDNWPGAITKYDRLADFYSAAEHNVATRVTFAVGDKAQILNSGDSLGIAGPSIFTYLQWTLDDVSAAAKVICVPDVTLKPYLMSGDASKSVSIADGLCGVLPTAMAELSYGWFWTGGQCPSDLISAMDGTYGTDSTVPAGDFTTVAMNDTNTIGFGIIAATTGACGYASAADAT